MAAHAGLLAVFDLSGRLWVTLFCLAVGFAGLALVAQSRARLSAGKILFVAVIMRGLLLPLPATLSDDVLRYVWDGKVLAAGSNPYVLTPDAEELSALRDERWERMPHRDVEAVYPPLALLLFSIAASSPAPEMIWKLMLIAIELAGCVLLLRLAVARGLESRRVALYAWNPLVTLEVAAMGHVDALGVALVIATVWGLSASVRGRRPAWAIAAAAAAGAAVLAKLVPLIALPVWASRARQGGKFAAIALAVVVLGLLPVLASTAGLPPGWVRFGLSWEFNGPLYEPLWRLIDGVGLDSAIKVGLDRAKEWTGEYELWNPVYPYIYPRLLAKGLLAMLLAALLWRAWRDRHASLLAVTGRSFAALLLCSATVYPWYLLWVLPWAALAGQRAWLVLSALILLSYIPQYTAIPLMPWVFAAIWVPFVGLLWRNHAWSSP